MLTATLASDRAYCRAILPRVSRTFALNIRLLDGRLGESVRVGYLLCRAADALEDSWPGTPDEIAARFALLRAAIRGEEQAARQLATQAGHLSDRREDLELVANLPRVWRVFRAFDEPTHGALVTCVETMAEGMARYAARAAGRRAGTPYLDTEAELHDYCWVVAGCVGVMLTQLFEREVPGGEPAVLARRRELSPVVGEALQLTNILLDWPSDVRRGRCYVPASWLAEAGLGAADLVGIERPGVAALRARLEQLARNALAQVPDYLATLPPGHMRYRLFCLWPSRWALASLEHARRDRTFPWGPRRPKLPKPTLWSEALASVLSPDGRVLRGTPGA